MLASVAIIFETDLALQNPRFCATQRIPCATMLARRSGKHWSGLALWLPNRAGGGHNSTKTAAFGHRSPFYGPFSPMLS